jgi:hypothetical protein
MRLRIPERTEKLALRLPASHLLHFFLVRAARRGALGLGGSLFARCPFQFLAFRLVGNLLGVGQVVTSFDRVIFGVPALRAFALQNSRSARPLRPRNRTR